MIEKSTHKPSLDRPAIYQIRVSGLLGEGWFDWADMTITSQSEDNGTRITTLVGTYDQAALLRLLRRLFSKGLPLISAIYIGDR